VEEEEPSEGETEVCLIGIIVKKRETEKRKKENGRIRGWDHVSLRGRLYVLQTSP